MTKEPAHWAPFLIKKKRKKKVRHFPGRVAGGATHPHFLESRTSIT